MNDKEVYSKGENSENKRGEAVKIRGGRRSGNKRGRGKGKA